MLKKLKRHEAKDPDLVQVQEHVRQFAAQVENNETLDGRLIEGLSVDAPGDIVINHKLNRIPRGYRVEDRTSAATFFRAAKNDKTITLTVSAACEFSVWVF